MIFSYPVSHSDMVILVADMFVRKFTQGFCCKLFIPVSEPIILGGNMMRPILLILVVGSSCLLLLTYPLLSWSLKQNGFKLSFPTSLKFSLEKIWFEWTPGDDVFIMVFLPNISSTPLKDDWDLKDIKNKDINLHKLRKQNYFSKFITIIKKVFAFILPQSWISFIYFFRT